MTSTTNYLTGTATDWTQDDTSLTTIKNPRVTSQQKILYDYYYTSSKIIRTEFTYAAISDYSGNTKEIREYDFSGALRRRTALYYLHEAISGYISLHILDRVRETLIYNGAGTLAAKSQVIYDDPALSIYEAPNAIRHDAAYGPAYRTRGLPSSVKRWYDLTQDLYVTTTMKYDECGNVCEITDPGLNITYTEYWLSAADNAHAFPLRVTNPLGHQAYATYSYKSGVPLTRTDPNGKVTTIQYDNRDRAVQVQKPSGGKKFIAYSDRAFCQYMCGPSDMPYATITEEITSTTSRDYRVQVDVMGRIDETTIFDGGGNIKTDTKYDAFHQVTGVTVYRDDEPEPDPQTTYSYSAPGYLGTATAPDRSSISYGYDKNRVTAGADNGFLRRYTYQEDGKVSQVREEDGNNQLNVDTNYAYDTMGRLITITQGVQTRSFTYDALGRLKSETHPENGTTTYTYDANSNLLTRTDARGITTTNEYDDLNRVTLRYYSDGTPSVSYFYDSHPAGSPIVIRNAVGRLTRVTTTTSGVVVTNYYGYCNCSAVETESTVITDGTTKTYTTSYGYDYLGQLTTISYPNGKIVTYTRDDKGREIKVSSTVLGQPADYVSSAEYLGPRGELTHVNYGTYWITQSIYTYSPYTLRLTNLQTLGLNLS